MNVAQYGADRQIATGTLLGGIASARRGLLEQYPDVA